MLSGGFIIFGVNEKEGFIVIGIENFLEMEVVLVLQVCYVIIFLVIVYIDSVVIDGMYVVIVEVMGFLIIDKFVIYRGEVYF